MIFVGADVHVRNSYLYAADESGQRLAHGRVANVAADLRRFCEQVRERSGDATSVRLVLESTTNSRAVRSLLDEAARTVGFDEVRADVLDARKLRIIAESVCKCDAVDAKILSDLARSSLALPRCYMPDDEEFALREHLRARHDLVRMRTMIKNRVHAILHRRGILTPTGGLFTKDGQAFLESAPLDEAGRAILARYEEVLEALEQRITASTRDLQGMLRRPRWAKPAALLRTMPGIGLITALTLLAELGDLKRFKNRAAVANYAGLVPVIRDSNTKHYSGGITHRGSAHLRQVLTEAAWMAVPRVPAYQALYERVSGRRGKSVAIVAVARRMLEDAVRMLWKDEAFRYVPVPRVNPPIIPAGSTQVTGAPRGDRKVASSVAG